MLLLVVSMGMTSSWAALDRGRQRGAMPWWPLVPAAIAFAAFLFALSPEPGPGDASELALQAYRLGVTHPPGYPIHTFLGYLLTQLVGDAAKATNLLSACGTAFAVGMLSAVTLLFTKRKWIATAGPLLFAFVPTVWESAISTEVYNVNVAFVAAALVLTLRWYRRRTMRRALAVGLLAGLSCGTSLANALLIPGWLALVWRRSRRQKSHLLVAILVAAMVGCAVLSWSVLRSRTCPPLGTSLDPSRFPDTWYYLTAAEYRTAGSLPLAFYLRRSQEHGLYFASSFLWIGIVYAGIGVWSLWRRHRAVATATVLMFVLNMAYFTWYPWPDYREMVTPSYFLCSLWICLGAACADRLRPSGSRLKNVASATPYVPTPTTDEDQKESAGRSHRPAAGIAGVSRIVLLAMSALLLLTGLRDHLGSEGRTPVTHFVQQSFSLFPQDAVVVAEWDTLMPLLYFQQVRGTRLDLLLVERSEPPRRYEWGDVFSWRSLVYERVNTRPVYVDAPDPVLQEVCKLEPAGLGWVHVQSCDATILQD